MKVMHPVLIVALSLSANAALAYSPDTTHALPYNGGCHLMTPSECQAHLGQLSQLPRGAEREVYLAAHRALIAERAALCGSRSKSSLSRAANR